MHSHHGDIHTEGLADDCEDCARYAEFPWELDTVAFWLLCDRNFRYRFGKEEERKESIPRSRAEEMAMAQLTTQMERMGRMFELAPDIIQAYLLDRWHIDLERL